MPHSAPLGLSDDKALGSSVANFILHGGLISLWAYGIGEILEKEFQYRTARKNPIQDLPRPLLIGDRRSVFGRKVNMLQGIFISKSDRMH